MTDTVSVPAQTSVRVVTTGGGGWGDPLDREIEMVVYDLQCGLISAQAAREDYGVAVRLQGRTWRADVAATEKRRADMKVQRGPLPMFDRGAAFAALQAAGKVSHPKAWTDPDAGWHAT